MTAGCGGDPGGGLLQSRRAPRAAVLAMLGLAPTWGFTQEGFAQDKKPAPPNPVGAHGGPWTQSVTAGKDAAVAGGEFDKRQLELIQKVSVYFNQMSDLKGLFVQ